MGLDGDVAVVRTCSWLALHSHTLIPSHPHTLTPTSSQVPMLDSYSPSEVDADDYYNAWGDETIAEDCYHRGEEWHSGPQASLTVTACASERVFCLHDIVYSRLQTVVISPVLAVIH